ncbi:MAG: SpoIIE family protein phosphatase [Bryobacterales bacterium]|nr:SpoIIE family protein phosphatase [Bryobacterales bacterium]
MLQRFTDCLFWDKRLPLRAQQAWFAATLFAPVALFAGLWLQHEIVGKIPAQVEIDRSSAIRTATAFASTLGQGPSGWSIGVKQEDNWDLYRYLSTQPKGTTLLKRLGDWAYAEVRLIAPEDSHNLVVQIGFNGEIIGHRFTVNEESDQTTPLPEPEATKLADAVAARRTAKVPGMSLSNRNLQTSGSGVSTTHRYQWKATFADLPKLTGTLTVRVHGGQVTEDMLDLDLASGAVPKEKTNLRNLKRVLYGIYLTILYLFVVVRYVRRRLQHEAPRERLYLVGVVVATFIAVTFYLSDIQLTTDSDQALPAWLPILLLGIGAIGAGLLGGVAYAGCEGDLREANPRLLTSLDAWLSGKWLSRNVGRSGLLGAVVLSWTVLLRNVIYLSGKPAYPGIDALIYGSGDLLTRAPWLSALGDSMVTATFVCLSILLCPLTFLLRYARTRRYLYWLLGLLAWGSLSVLSDEPLTFPYSTLVTLVHIAGLMFSFFAVDFLASIVVVSGYSFVVSYAALGQIAPLWANQDERTFLILGIVLCMSAYGAFLGRVVNDADVRPAYAREIQERLTLQSEVEAAREAQQRLLPAAPPCLPGLSIAASCHPAEAVSGDFYDFFPINQHQIGMLICDGGGNGLATALSIALAKGFLMHKAASGLPPAETLMLLHASLGKELHGVNAEGLCYALIDTREATLQLARIGDTPALLLPQGAVVSEGRREQDGVVWYECSARLDPDQRAILYTNGLCRLVGVTGQRDADRWLLRRIGKQLHLSADTLHQTIQQFVFGRRMFRSARLQDDVTVVVIGVEQTSAGTMERVA